MTRIVAYTIFQEMIFFGLTGLDSYDPATKASSRGLDRHSTADKEIEMGASPCSSKAIAPFPSGIPLTT